VTELGRQNRCSYLHFVKYINPSVPASVHRTNKNIFKGTIRPKQPLCSGQQDSLELKPPFYCGVKCGPPIRCSRSPATCLQTRFRNRKNGEPWPCRPASTQIQTALHAGHRKTLCGVRRQIRLYQRTLSVPTKTACLI